MHGLSVSDITAENEYYELLSSSPSSLKDGWLFHPSIRVYDKISRSYVLDLSEQVKV